MTECESTVGRLPKKPAKEKLSLPIQKQLDKTFQEDKQRNLQLLATSSAQSCDNSPKGDVDAACVPIMQLLNAHPDYVTTSSCSGRIAVFHSVAPSASVEESTAQRSQTAAIPKRGGASAVGWLYVTHDTMSTEAIDDVVHSLMATSGDSGYTSSEQHPPLAQDTVGPSGVTQASVGTSSRFVVPSHGVVSVKCEPFVMHVQCRTLEAAKQLMSIAVSDAGFRNSGVTLPGARIIVAIRHAGLGLDAPVSVDGVGVASSSSPVGAAYLRKLLLLCNEKLTQNLQRVKLLHTFLSGPRGVNPTSQAATTAPA